MKLANALKGRRVFVTGNTGFKGFWLCSWLLDLGAEVAGYSKGVHAHNNKPSGFEILGLGKDIRQFTGDVADLDRLRAAVEEFQPDLVIHLAAQALVRRAYEEPVRTFTANSLGSVSILECIRHVESVRAAVLVTSDKCYENVEWTWGYRENDQLGGIDPYSASKACAEIMASCYMRSYFLRGEQRIATARAGNVIGGGHWAKYAVLPDCARAWGEGKKVYLRSPSSTRPWQHVLEALSGYLWLAVNLLEGNDRIRNQAFNLGPQPTASHTVLELVQEMAKHWPANGGWEVVPAEDAQVEAHLLKLCCDKAFNVLRWRPVLDFEGAVRFTAQWYRTFYENGEGSMRDLTMEQIQAYSASAAQLGLPWAAAEAR